MPWKCPVCGHENPDDTETCEVCGYVKGSPVLAEPRSPEAGQPQQPPTASDAQPPGAPSPAPQQPEPPAQQPGPAQQEAPQPEPPAEPAQQPRILYLEVIDSPAREIIGRKIPLLFDAFKKISIGKSPENVVIIPDATVSRRHALIERTSDNKIIIKDLGSTNGTYIYDPNEATFKKIEEAELKPGLLLRLGATTLRVTTE